MLATSSRSKAVLIAAVLFATGLAGCVDAGPAGDDDVSYGSYEDAKQAPGTEWEPVSGDSSIALRLLQPSGTSTETGEQDIVFLLYDTEADEPIEGIAFEPQDDYEENCSPAHAFCAEMPAMGHGTSPEESPVHREHGVYAGMTTFSMSGDWLVNVNPMIDGEVVEFDIELTADGEDDMDME